MATKRVRKPAAAKAAPAKPEPVIEAASVEETTEVKVDIFKVIERFKDSDDNRIYEVHETYEGKRPEYFAGSKNKCGRPFLKKV